MRAYKGQVEVNGRPVSRSKAFKLALRILWLCVKSFFIRETPTEDVKFTVRDLAPMR